MKNFKLALVALFLLTQSFNAFGFGESKIKKLKWKDLDVVWLEDNQFPTFSFSVYFADGALSDPKNAKGATSGMIQLLDSGTRRFSQKDIADNLEFYGASYGGNVSHEYSTYFVSGLVKDSIPTMKKICHLFADATYPKKEVKKAHNLAATNLKNMVNQHGALASRSFREISLRGSPFDYPAGGKYKDIKTITQKRMLKQLEYFNKKVKKRIYITGPKDILKLENIITEECGWDGSANFVRSPKYKHADRSKPNLVLVTVPKANQAQIRIGRTLGPDEIKRPELLGLTAEFLGGGFTSRLMRELRVKRGLTYSVSSFVAGQKSYGRAAISTFTKNETLYETIKVTKETLEKLAKGDFKDHDLALSQGGLAGSYPFRFESNSSYLSQLMILDHVGRPYRELYRYPELVRSYKREEVAKSVDDIFNWNKLTIVVVGSKSLLKQMKKLGPVVVVDYKRYL